MIIMLSNLDTPTDVVGDWLNDIHVQRNWFCCDGFYHAMLRRARL